MTTAIVTAQKVLPLISTSPILKEAIAHTHARMHTHAHTHTHTHTHTHSVFQKIKIILGFTLVVKSFSSRLTLSRLKSSHVLFSSFARENLSN